MKHLKILLVGSAVLIGTISLFVYVKRHGFSAREKPNYLESYFAKTVRRLIVPSDVKALKNPLEPSPLLIAEARDHFADHCASCHANNGSGKTKLGQNMYPPAPDMRTGYTQDLTDGELLYIIKEGIRFSGMPSWGGEDEENWKLVHFVRHLPKLTPEEIGFMFEINGLEEQ